MAVLELGRGLLTVAACVIGAVFLFSLLSVLRKDRRLVRAARNGLYIVCAAVAGSAACLVYGFLAGEYNNEYVYNYSERQLPVLFDSATINVQDVLAADATFHDGREALNDCDVGDAIVVLFFEFITELIEAFP